MTAKHRKGKNNQKQEENFFKNEVIESDVRAGGNNHIFLLVLFLTVVIGGAIGTWFCFQQHLTLTYLTDNLMEMQMKIVKLQSSHEELRQSSGKQHVSENLETRLNALEESYALAQKQVGMALATAEQLKTSDLPAQVLSLHTEMKARLAEMQRATVSLEQLSQLQTMLTGKSEEFEDVRARVEALATLSADLSEKVEGLRGNLREAGSKLGERDEQLAALSTTLDEQAAEVLRLKQQLEDSTLETATFRELLEQLLPQAGVEQQLDAVLQTLRDHHSLHSELKAQLENIEKQVTRLMGHTETLGVPLAQRDESPTDPGAAAASPEEETLDTDVKWEAEENKQPDEILLDEVPDKEEQAPAEEEDEIKEDQREDYLSSLSSESTEVDTAQAEVEIPDEEESEGQNVEEALLEEERHKLGEEVSEMQNTERDKELEEETASEREEVEEESPLKDRSHKAEEEETVESDEDDQQDGETASEGEEVEEASLTHEDNHKGEKEMEEPLLEEEPAEEEAAETQEDQDDVAAEKFERRENDSSAQDKCK